MASGQGNESGKNRNIRNTWKKLSQVSGVEIADFADLKEALLKRMEFFAQMGCSVSDHALEYVMYAPAAEEKVNEIFKKRLNGESISREEEMIFKTAFYAVCWKRIS